MTPDIGSLLVQQVASEYISRRTFQPESGFWKPHPYTYGASSHRARLALLRCASSPEPIQNVNWSGAGDITDADEWVRYLREKGRGIV